MIMFLYVFIFLNLLISVLFGSYLINTSFLKHSVIGRSITATVSLIVEGSGMNVFIHHPQNTTYNFSIGQAYSLDLNVSSDFLAQTWRYTLYDARHKSFVNQSVVFTPNSSVVAVRWNNNLTVFANDSNGNIASNQVFFFVSVPSSAPLLQNFSTLHWVCEDQIFSTTFNASDVDEDNLTASISPTDPFFVIAAMTEVNITWRTSEIFSGTLDRGDVGLHTETLSVSDGSLSDSRQINLTVIAINHAPSLNSIGVQTLYTQGENKTFSRQLTFTDAEHGNDPGSGNFTFNLTFLSGGYPFLRVNASGYMNGSANATFVGTHSLRVCMNDTGLSNPDVNISNVCGQTGGVMSHCINFNVTVTNANRPPIILNFYPLEENFNISPSASNHIFFNITKSDPDGTVPDGYWYVDMVLKETDTGSLIDTFNFTFADCEQTSHVVDVVITDGLANDSVQWNITLLKRDCPTGGGGGGGSGAAVSGICTPLWACNPWKVCQHTGEGLGKGTLFSHEYRRVKPVCDGLSFDDFQCGFQRRECFDVKNCNTPGGKPKEIQACEYVSVPSCTDSVTNCHDGDCEVLVDCGGPCAACATCSDRIQNQKEEGIDCGGPCPICAIEALQSKTRFSFWLWILLIIALIVIYIQIRRIKRLRRVLKEYK